MGEGRSSADVITDVVQILDGFLREGIAVHVSD